MKCAICRQHFTKLKTFYSATHVNAMCDPCGDLPVEVLGSPIAIALRVKHDPESVPEPWRSDYKRGRGQ